MDQRHAPYPVTLDVEYPDGDLDRLTTFFRPIMVIPIAIILALVTGPTMHVGTTKVALESGGLIFLATALMIVFRQKYPRWWFDWNLNLQRQLAPLRHDFARQGQIAQGKVPRFLRSNIDQI